MRQPKTKLEAKGAAKSGCYKTQANYQNQKHTLCDINTPQRQGVFGEIQGLP